MQKNPDGFHFEDAMRLAATPTGRQLLSLLQQSDPAALQNVMAQAAAGDMTAAQNMLQPLLADEEVQKLLKQLGG